MTDDKWRGIIQSFIRRKGQVAKKTPTSSSEFTDAERRRATKVFQPDKDISNADWPKRTDDLLQYWTPEPGGFKASDLRDEKKILERSKEIDALVKKHRRLRKKKDSAT